MSELLKEYKSAVGRVTKGWLALDKKCTRMPLPDHTKNYFNHYWPTAIVAGHIANLQDVARLAPDMQERAGVLYSLAHFYYQCLMLDDSERICAEIVELTSVDHPPVVRLRAEVQARRGRWEQAVRLAKMLELDPRAHAFRISEEDLRAVYKAGQSNAP